MSVHAKSLSLFAGAIRRRVDPNDKHPSDLDRRNLGHAVLMASAIKYRQYFNEFPNATAFQDASPESPPLFSSALLLPRQIRLESGRFTGFTTLAMLIGGAHCINLTKLVHRIAERKARQYSEMSEFLLKGLSLR